MKLMRIFLVTIVALPFALICILFGLWLLSFVDPAPNQDDCAFNSVNKSQYQSLLSQAKAQDWTLWPGLSKGIFWPSSRFFAADDSVAEKVGERLRQAINELKFDHDSADAQLAATHAVMRSIGAEYVSIFEIPILGFPDRSVTTIVLTYFIPQRRFAPLCLPCVLWWYTTIMVTFRREVATDKYTPDQLVVLNAGLKYVPSKSAERNIPGPCPVFPRKS
jgi:hypothetical protein